MSTPSTLDVASLLMPVSDEQPAGPELRSATDNVKKLFSDVRDARNRAIKAERRLRDLALMSEDERKREPGPTAPPDWESVRSKSITALATSKDLWIAAWLIEALTRLHGFGGLRDGVRLAHGLCATFWIDVHPQETKEDGFVTRFAKLAGLDGGLGGLDSEGTLIAPIRNVLITADTAVGQFSLGNYDEALELDKKDPDVRRQRAEQGAPTIEVFQQALTATNAKFLQQLVEDLDGAHREFVAFITFLRQKETEVVAAGGQGFVPPSSTIENLLDKSLGTVKGLTSHVLPAQHEPTGTSVGRPAEDALVDDRANERLLASSPIKSRQDAFQVLGRVSEFFRVTEPHSPISYALEQVVRWGRMSLPELLSELVTDKSSRAEIFKRTGIAEKSSDE